MMFFCFGIVLIVSLVTISRSENDSPFLVKGKCKGLWRPEKLVGRCFGLKKHTEYPQLSGIKVVRNSAECKSICCNMGAECISWQYEQRSLDCKLGEKVRLGHEHADTPFWCDPYAPSTWNGRKILSRQGRTCTWKPEVLDTQCFGLGSERLNTSNGRLDTSGCEKQCCEDPTCMTWQEMPGRGCYYSDSMSVYSGTCDEAGNAIYDGARKCLPGYCGGQEHIFLKNSTSSFRKGGLRSNAMRV